MTRDLLVLNLKDGNPHGFAPKVLRWFGFGFAAGCEAAKPNLTWPMTLEAKLIHIVRHRAVLCIQLLGITI